MSLPIPSFFNPQAASDYNYRADTTALLHEAQSYVKLHNIRPVGSDTKRVTQLVIDQQKTFCHTPETGGDLFVSGRSGDGAIQDSRRLAEFTYRNLDTISEIYTTMDTHFAHQIFFASFWLGEDGKHPDAHQTIELSQIEDGTFRVNPMVSHMYGLPMKWLQDYVMHYCQSLADQGKYTLYIWPPHAMLGDSGHSLVGVIQEMCLFHSFARGSSGMREIKGGHALTENYSVLRPEVMMRHDGKPLMGANSRFIDQIVGSDAVIIGGEAGSHCVKASIEDLLAEVMKVDPKLLNRIYLLRDCMSAVVIPGVADFTDDMNNALDKFAAEGANVVNSTDDMRTWPGFPVSVAA